jgi:hypothetical protein
MRSFRWVVHAKSFAILGARETSDFLLSVVCHSPPGWQSSSTLELMTMEGPSPIISYVSHYGRKYLSMACRTAAIAPVTSRCDRSPRYYQILGYIAGGMRRGS